MAAREDRETHDVKQAIILGQLVQAGILTAANRAQMADVEQLKKMIPLVTRETLFC